MSAARDQIAFGLRLDELKRVHRRTYLTDGSRHENTAEHSWHLAMYVLTFLPFFQRKGLDVFRMLKMALLHDVPEIIAGDTFIYDEAARAAAHECELSAARELFGMLPVLGEELLALWQEFEAKETPEARALEALDRLQPVLQNVTSGCRAWREHDVTLEMILTKNGIIARELPEIWPLLVEMLEQAVLEGSLTRSGKPTA